MKFYHPEPNKEKTKQKFQFPTIYRVIWTSDSSSVAKWRRIMFFDAGIPIAVAMTSALKVGSRTTKAP